MLLLNVIHDLTLINGLPAIIKHKSWASNEYIKIDKSGEMRDENNRLIKNLDFWALHFNNKNQKGWQLIKTK